MKQIKHKLLQVTDKIFALEIPNDWDRAMVFLRAQEFYESASPKFKGKSFDIWDYIKWYSTERPYATGSFSYPNDWAAYNIPIKTVVECLDKNKTAVTPYDVFMDEILHDIFNKFGVTEKDTYLVGVKSMQDVTLDHELSHALWYTSPEFKKSAQEILKAMPTELLAEATNKLQLMGYAKTVLLDEVVAYSATGDGLRIFKSSEHKPFANLFTFLLQQHLPKKKVFKKAA